MTEEKQGEPNLRNILDTLNKVDPKLTELAISLAHFSETGNKLPAIMATADINEEETAGKRLTILQEMGYVQRGRAVQLGRKDKYGFPTRDFQEDPEGNMWRLEPKAKEAILKKVFEHPARSFLNNLFRPKK